MADPLHQFGRNRSRADGIDTDPFVDQAQGHGLGELGDAPFAGTVGNLVFQSQDRDDR